MKTDTQTSVPAQCVNNNPCLEHIYIQGKDGMQTGRSSWELAEHSTRWWFIQTMEEQKPFISKSYYSVATGMPCASIFFPMYNNNEKLAGVYAADLKLDFLQNLIGEFSDEESGKISFVIDGEGVVVAHPDTVKIEELYNYKELSKTVPLKDSNGNLVKDEDGNITTTKEDIEVSDSFKQAVTQAMGGNSASTTALYEGAQYYASYTDIPLKGAPDSWSLLTLTP